MPREQKSEKVEEPVWHTPVNPSHPQNHTGRRTLEAFTPALGLGMRAPEQIERLNPKKEKSSPCRYIAVLLRRCRPKGSRVLYPSRCACF